MLAQSSCTRTINQSFNPAMRDFTPSIMVSSLYPSLQATGVCPSVRELIVCMYDVQLDRACMRIPCKINFQREFFTNLNSESSFVLKPGCGESISVEWEVIGAKLKKLEKRKEVGTTSLITISTTADVDSPAQHSNTKVQSEFS